MKKWLMTAIWLAAACLGGFSGMAAEQPLKIAVIDMNRVFEEYNKLFNEKKGQ